MANKKKPKDHSKDKLHRELLEAEMRRLRLRHQAEMREMGDRQGDIFGASGRSPSSPRGDTPGETTTESSPTPNPNGLGRLFAAEMRKLRLQYQAEMQGNGQGDIFGANGRSPSSLRGDTLGKTTTESSPASCPNIFDANGRSPSSPRGDTLGESTTENSPTPCPNINDYQMDTNHLGPGANCETDAAARQGNGPGNGKCSLSHLKGNTLNTSLRQQVGNTAQPKPTQPKPAKPKPPKNRKTTLPTAAKRKPPQNDECSSRKHKKRFLAPSFCRVYKAKTPTSQRTRIYASIMADSIRNFSPANRTASKRLRRKIAKWQNMHVNPSPKHAMKINGTIVFSGKKKSTISVPSHVKAMGVHKAMHTRESTEGLRLIDPQTKEAVFHLAPRKQVILSQPQDPGLVGRALSNLEACGKTVERGNKRQVFCETPQSKYNVVGVKANRGHKGVCHAELENLTQEHSQAMLELVRRCEKIAAACIDTAELMAMMEAKTVGNWESMQSKGSDAKKANLYAGLACGRNVFLNAHDDDDYIRSIVTLQGVPEAEHFKEDDPVIAYFVFPTYGVAVALRLGDVLVFNPKVFHCVSSRTETNADFFCLSMYLKTAVVGKNNNSLPLSALEEQLANKCNV